MTRAELEDFLFHEAALLDDWQLDAWLALWDPAGSYVVPALDHPDGDPRTTLALIADDMAMLRSRVDQLVRNTTVAEIPRSRTRRSITNVRILEATATSIRATSNFVVHRARGDRLDTFAGAYIHDLVIGDETRIRGKRATLLHESLAQQGKISILL